MSACAGTVLDAAGGRIAQVSRLQLDLDVRCGAFAGVAMMRREGRRIVFVPLAGATLQPASIAVTCGKLLARCGPSARPGETLPVGAEVDRFAHCDLPYVPPEPCGGCPYI